jgi:putative redox protein
LGIEEEVIMAKSNIVLVDGMQFVGSSDSGHAVLMDAPGSVGGNNSAPTPMELLLSAFGGCTGMDVISILRKKKQNVKRLEVQVKGDKAKDHPRMYTTIHVNYIVAGRDVSEDAVKRSIGLSLDKYCSVGAMLGRAAKITHSFQVVSE